MTLRLRLVLALVTLATVGLAVFGVATYAAYARSQYARLDDDIRDSLPGVLRSLADEAGLAPGAPGPARGPQPRLPVGSYGEMRDASGAVVAQLTTSSGDRPDLPDDLSAGDPAATGGTAAGQAGPETEGTSGGSPSDPRDDWAEDSRLLDTGSVDGPTRWRVIVAPDPFRTGYTAVWAVPTTDVRASLERLVLIEAAAATALLALLAAGSWLVLRRGLRPLERMAGVARTITAGDLTAGDLTARVEPADGRTEVGQLGLALNTMLDDLEAAFRQREASEARLRQFLADASHELRTPLTSIQGFAELFRLGEPSAPAGEDAGGEDGTRASHGGAPAGDRRLDLATMMRRIEEESTRMRRLVDDLLLLARLDQTRPAERTSVDLAVLAADACSDAVAADPTRPVTLDAPEPVVVLGDENHLRQAVGNLMSNAVRHTPPGTAIEVGAHIAGGRAVVTVRDHGPGLDDEARAHAFDRFWRSDTARAGAGAGLGLSIVAGIAAEHGGRATVSNAPGGGARFALELPIDSPPAPEEAPRAGDRADAGNNRSPRAGPTS